MYSTYVLRSLVNARFYIGHTTNLERRLQEHNGRMSIYTKNRGPWELVYHEQYTTRSEAIRRERYFKTGKGRDELKRLLARN